MVSGPRVHKALLWILAAVISAGTAIFQQMTGPSYPRSGGAEIAGTAIRFRFERSHVSTDGAPVRIACGDRELSGRLEWRRHKTGEPFVAIPLRREGGILAAELPPEPPAGKVDYRIVLRKGDSSLVLPPEGPVTLRYRGEVPGALLVPHILVMFLGMLFAARSGLEVFSPGRNYRRLVLTTVLLLAIGGFLLGPAVQKCAFGAWWTGWPFGRDLTDNKTAVAIVAWIIALLTLRRPHPERRVLAAAIVTFVVYLVPHSLLGSELDYNSGASVGKADTISLVVSPVGRATG